VTDIERRVVGLIVDAASEVLRVALDDIEAPPEVFGDNELKYVTGVGKLNGRLVILIDLTKILQKGEFKRLGDISIAALA
jgi:purine-binding chemotaxis protein CheW